MTFSALVSRYFYHLFRGWSWSPTLLLTHTSLTYLYIVISLKDMFFERSESLVGICRDVSSNSSRTMTLDLTKFDRKNKKRSHEGEGDNAEDSGLPKRPRRRIAAGAEWTTKEKHFLYCQQIAYSFAIIFSFNRKKIHPFHYLYIYMFALLSRYDRCQKNEYIGSCRFSVWCML